jgi:hypothetical protein
VLLLGGARDCTTPVTDVPILDEVAEVLGDKSAIDALYISIFSISIRGCRLSVK